MAWPVQVLIVAQESGEREKLYKICSAAGVHTVCCSTLLEAQSFLSGHSVSAVFAETVLPDSDLQAVRATVRRLQNGVPIVALIWGMDWDSYLGGMGAGAFDCLNLPASTLETKRVLWSALQAFSTTVARESVVA